MRPARLALILVVAAIGGFALAVWLFPGRAPEPGGAAAPAPAAAPSAPGAAPPSAELRVESSGTVSIDAASLEPGRPVALRLVLGEPSRDGEARPVRVLSPDGRVFEGQGSLDADRLEARLEIDPAFLTPGRYLVEVRTTEQTHFPLRRYVLEVR